MLIDLCLFYVWMPDCILTVGQDIFYPQTTNANQPQTSIHLFTQQNKPHSSHDVCVLSWPKYSSHHNRFVFDSVHFCFNVTVYNWAVLRSEQLKYIYFCFFFHILHKLGIWILALKWTEGIKVSRSRYQVELTKQCFENFIRIVNQEIRIILYSSFIDPALTSLWTITATVATPTKVHTTNQTTASVNLNRKHKLKHWNRIWSSWL